MAKKLRRFVSALLISTALLAGLLVPVPGHANWWIVRSSDEKCLVVDIEPVPGNNHVTRMGSESYPSEQDAEADLKRLCTDASGG